MTTDYTIVPFKSKDQQKQEKIEDRVTEDIQQVLDRVDPEEISALLTVAIYKDGRRGVNFAGTTDPLLMIGLLDCTKNKFILELETDSEVTYEEYDGD